MPRTLGALLVPLLLWCVPPRTVATEAPSIAEEVDANGFADQELRLTCRDLDSTMAILNASFRPTTPGDNRSSQATEASQGRHFRSALNRRCSGVNHCSFLLSSDFEEAGRLWGPGTVSIRYVCMKGNHLVRYCNGELVAGSSGVERGRDGAGYVASPGYPKYYVAEGCEWTIRPRHSGQRVRLTMLDLSIRGPGEGGQCSDRLEVLATGGAAGERLLLSRCGEAPEAVRIESPEEAPALRVVLRSGSGSLFPKRGLLFHFQAIGCSWPPPRPPTDGYMVSRNASSALYMCCVGFRFPDSGRRQRELRCDEQHGLWRADELSGPLLPDCETDGDTSLLKGNVKKPLVKLSASSEKLKMRKEADLMFDILIPTIIIGILLLGNGVILFIIFRFKKRKLAAEVQEEELQIAQNGVETTVGRPSDV